MNWLAILILLAVLSAVALALCAWGLAKHFNDNGDLVPILFIAGLVCSLAAFCIFVVAIPVKSVERRNCHYAANSYSLPWKWDFFAGCFVKVDGRYVKLDQYRFFREQKP